ncbi:MAG: Beta-glucosidase A [Candidatus Moranbacteria bacterium GW2011_GWE1_49_15]|nr:MAG: Beta-glucosidase A [Candidatus Moranbacteria bacterium GW2011_GWE2_47_10]KKW06494.1 MAG: Beta-glucosidase A [Candidatus Moranbacteria bacterium GW2011_GWE1_49_15]HBP01105.1 glycoside hydrolase family 1 protein [Candidatus Moranbacteria bacterium]
MENEKLVFPKGFLWGASTSSHQVEGYTKNNWTEWERENAERLARGARKKWKQSQQERFPEMFDSQNYISGKACDHYNLFKKDFDLAKELGHNAHRFSIEWSRIEPEEGIFDQKEIEHYREVIEALRENGMEPFVTLWHWTDPIWFAKKGGWTSADAVKDFKRFVEKITYEFQDIVKYWIVVNEPNVGMGFGYLLGSQPPAKKGPISFLQAYFNLLKAYRQCYGLIHKTAQGAHVGFAHSFYLYEAEIWKPINGIVSSVAAYFSDYFFTRTDGYRDFIGCNYYQEITLSFNKKKQPDRETTDLGWRIYPVGIYDVLLSLKKYGLPVYITENGIADADDSKREKFIKEHLRFVHKAISEGVDVRGYMHWSLIDNFEFPDMRGFWPRFGLVEVDFETQERKVRPSALEYKKICESNELEIEG